MNKKLQLAKQILGLAAVTVCVWLIFKACSGKNNTSGFQIEETAMKVELIRDIADLATISYEDEVVVDSVEYYHSLSEQVAGNLQKMTNPDNFKHGIKASNIKRRLTLIVRGKIHYGFDLKDKKFQITESDTLVEILLPEPKILDLSSPPSDTRIFQENGHWKDYEINRLKTRARHRIERHFAALKLADQAKTNLKKVILPLLPKGKRVRISFM